MINDFKHDTGCKQQLMDASEEGDKDEMENKLPRKNTLEVKTEELGEQSHNCQENKEYKMANNLLFKTTRIKKTHSPYARD